MRMSEAYKKFEFNHEEKRVNGYNENSECWIDLGSFSEFGIHADATDFDIEPTASHDELNQHMRNQILMRDES